MMQFLCLLLIALLNSTSGRNKVPLIIDTDIGGDFDDAVAVAYAISRQDIFDIKLILTATYNTTAKALLTAKYVQYMNASHIDIGIGIVEPGGCGGQCPWADGYTFDQYGPGKIYQDGIKQAEQLIAEASPTAPIYIVGIAPFTNFGQMFTDNQEYKKNIRLIIMGGHIHPASGEYNMDQNTSASQITFNHTNTIPYASNICDAPIDTTEYYQIYGSNYQRFYDAQATNVISSTVIANYQVWYDNGGKNHGAYRPFNVTTATSTMFDPEAMYIASIMAEMEIKQQKTDLVCTNGTIPYIGMEGLPMVVDSKGETVSDPNNGIQTVYSATKWIPNMNQSTWDLATFQVDWMLKYQPIVRSLA